MKKSFVKKIFAVIFSNIKYLVTRKVCAIAREFYFSQDFSISFFSNGFLSFV